MRLQTFLLLSFIILLVVILFAASAFGPSVLAAGLGIPRLAGWVIISLLIFFAMRPFLWK